MFVVDTNVLLCAVNTSATEHVRCRQLLDQAAQAILAAPGLSVLHETDRHADVAREVFSGRPPVAGSLVFHAHTAVLLREHGVDRIYTRDTAFHTFPFLTVIDPMA